MMSPVFLIFTAILSFSAAVASEDPPLLWPWCEANLTSTDPSALGEMARAYDASRKRLEDLFKQAPSRRLVRELADLDHGYVYSREAAGAKIKLTPMKLFYYVQDFMSQSPVRFFTEAEREQLKVRSVNGQLVGADDAPINTGGRAMFVLGEQGELYVVPLKMLNGDSRINHSSVFGARPVAAAGEIEIHDGYIAYIDNSSGHYVPLPETTKLVFQALGAQDPKFKVPADVDHSKEDWL